MWSSGLTLDLTLSAPRIVSGPAGDSLMWDAIQGWPDSQAGRRWPPEMLALLALARAHPEEYDHLRESESVLRALGG